MMFMMPIPPTIKRDCRDAGEQELHHGRRRRGGICDVLQIADGKVVGLRRHYAVPLPQKGGDVRLHLRERRIRPSRRDHQHVHVCLPGYAFHRRRVGDQDDIVLILTKAALAARLQDADDGERNVADEDALTER